MRYVDIILRSAMILRAILCCHIAAMAYARYYEHTISRLRCLMPAMPVAASRRRCRDVVARRRRHAFDMRFYDAALRVKIRG